jgi:RNA polymerase-binding transcription factor DksA
VETRERQRIENRLEERLAELVRIRLAMHESDEGSRDIELAHVDNHPGDQGTETHDEELSETASIFFEEEERRIDEARRALAEGTYGTCQVCRQPIPAERLEAMPEAVRCVEDQRHFEGLHRQHTPTEYLRGPSGPAPA